MALKNCKECGKQISTDANPCPHCGKKNPHGMSGVVKYGGGFLAVMFGLPVMMAFCGSEGRSGSSGASTSSASVAVAEAPPLPPAPAMEVDALQLWRDYDANEVSADNVYKGRRLAVTGKVASIDKDFMGDVIVKLAAPNQFMATHATMQKSEASAAAALSKGNRVTVICEGGGLIVGSPILKDCAFRR